MPLGFKHMDFYWPVSFTIEQNSKEGLALAIWTEEHNKTCPYFDDGTSFASPQGAIGGRMTFEFTITGLGVISKVKCACGKDVDLTQYDEW